MRPLISVIIPCYNAEKFVEKAVRSIMEQSYSNLEIIVINDCSNDNTANILKGLAKEDNRIKYIENDKNLKLPKTLNKAISLSTGEYIARMDADDISLPTRLEKQIQYMLDNPKVDIIGMNMQYINENDEPMSKVTDVPIEHRSITNKLPLRSSLCHPTILAKKSFFIDLEGYLDLYYAEDYELWIRGWLQGKIFHNLKEIGLYYRYHSAQMTGITYNSKNADSVKSFLLNYFKITKDFRFLLGYMLQTYLGYQFIKIFSYLKNRKGK